LEDIQACVAETLANFHRIDVLFNNAGFGRLKWLEDLQPLEDIDAQLQVNLKGAIYAAWAVTPVMVENRKGHIINVDSLAGLIATPTYSVYAATKFGLRGFNEALRRELHPWGIHVSIIYPEAWRRNSTSTQRQAKNRNRNAQRLRLDAEYVAKLAWRLVKHPRRQVILPRYMVR
jgi:short-subunit dehydrogenase